MATSTTICPPIHPHEPPLSKLNLGCGTDIRPGWINLDIAPLK